MAALCILLSEIAHKRPQEDSRIKAFTEVKECLLQKARLEVYTYLLNLNATLILTLSILLILQLDATTLTAEMRNRQPFQPRAARDVI